MADIVGCHGLRGALIIFSHTRPASAVAGYSRLWTVVDSTPQPWSVLHCAAHGKRMLLQLDGIETRSAAEQLQKQKLWVQRDEVPLDDDEILWDDLIGMEVLNCCDHGATQKLGTVSGVQDFGAQDILMVNSDKGEWMIPFIDEVILNINEDQRRITIQLLEGMDACFTPSC